MKKLFLMLAVVGMVGTSLAYHGGEDDKTKKKEGTSKCCKKDAETKSCCKKKSGEAKVCSDKKSEAKATTGENKSAAETKTTAQPQK